MDIRNYRPDDYEDLKSLYLQSNLFGGQFDAARDSREKLEAVTRVDSQSILVCEDAGRIVGTVSLIESGRVAWLFRFAVLQIEKEKEALQALHQKACAILRARGHSEVLVYTPIDDARLEQRYLDLDMNKGSAYTCFWQSIDP